MGVPAVPQAVTDSEMASGVFARIRRTCQAEVEQCGDVSIDAAQLEAFAASLSPQEVKEAAGSTGMVRLPLQFETQASEVNVFTLIHLLAFGSGYEKELQESCRSGWRECIQFGVLGMYISGNELTSDFLKNFSDLHVNNFFRIPTHEDVPSEMHPAIQISQPGPLMPLARSIREQIRAAGEAAEAAGAQSPGDLVTGILKDCSSAAQAVERLGSTIAGFDDRSPSGAEFHCKAQALMETLSRRFPGEDSGCFGFSDLGDMTASADSLLPAALRRLQIIKVSESVSSAADENQEVSEAPWVPALRASAVLAVDLIAAAVGGGVTARQVEAVLRASPAAAEAEAAARAAEGSSGPAPHVDKATVAY